MLNLLFNIVTQVCRRKYNIFNVSYKLSHTKNSNELTLIFKYRLHIIWKLRCRMWGAHYIFVRVGGHYFDTKHHLYSSIGWKSFHFHFYSRMWTLCILRDLLKGPLTSSSDLLSPLCDPIIRQWDSQYVH